MQFRSVSRRWWRVLFGLLAAVTLWFFFQVWQNVSVLANRTLLGVGYASELLDHATDLEIARLTGNSVVGPAEAFREALARYEDTIAIAQDRSHWEKVRRSFAVYRETWSRETWLQLRGDVRLLHAARLQRAQTFASDSRDSFALALGINVGGLVLSSVLLLVLSLGVSLRRRVEDRPDNF